MDDRTIVKLYWERSEQAISETEKKYGRYCHAIAFGILNDHEDAKEVVNDTYLKTWNTVPPNRPDPLKPYVGMISRQLALDCYDRANAAKRGGGQIPQILEELSECIPDPDSMEDLGESFALRDALNRFVRRLPEEKQVIFIRRYWYASSIAELARDFQRKESQIAMLLLRMRQKLQIFLQKEGFSV